MALYAGDIRSPGGVTEEFCRSVIDHSRTWCDSFISEHVFPGGSLDSLATWLDNHPEEEAVADPNQDIIDGIGEEAEEQQLESTKSFEEDDS